MTALDELIGELMINPFEAGDEVEVAAAERTRRVLHGAIVAEAPDGRAPRRRAAPGRRGRRLTGRLVPALGLGGLAIAVAVVVLITQVFVQGGSVQPQLAAAAVLKRAAQATLASPPAHLGPGRYWYEEDVGTYLDGASTQRGQVYAYVSEVERYWIGARHWIRRERLVRVRPAQPIRQPWQRAAMRMIGANPSLSERGTSYDLPVSYAQLIAAPTSTRALGNFVLRAEVAPGFTPARMEVPDIMINSIHDILIEPMVPARLRAGLYRVAATIPGAKVLGLVHDSLGRSALAIGFADRDQQTEYELLFDPVSYALLDIRQTALRRVAPHIAAGSVGTNTAYMASGLVSRIGEVPRSGSSRTG